MSDTQHNSTTIRTLIDRRLNSLGSTYTEVAKTLHREGIKGIPCDEDSCPITRYLHNTLPAGWNDVRTTPSTVTVKPDPEVYDVITCPFSVELPIAVREFISFFDGLWPYVTDEDTAIRSLLIEVPSAS